MPDLQGLAAASVHMLHPAGCGILLSHLLFELPVSISPGTVPRWNVALLQAFGRQAQLKVGSLPHTYIEISRFAMRQAG